ncbi:antitermination protein, partial [Escherichia coli CB7326]
HNA